MSLERVERTSIWKSTLAARPNDEFENEREILRSSFKSLRKNASSLVTKIASAIPELTQHEISHLDALWEIGSLIIGDNFELSPLEGFVLGAAFLIHDSALCFEAYENGIEGLRSTIQWKDSYEHLRTLNPELPISEIEGQADFVALRSLHANQAENLLNKKWKDAAGNDFYLLDNQELRLHLGKLIGKIAASHNWDIETIFTAFNAQQNVPTGYPTEWRIEPIKLACILRCADAAHLDNERAPDFLYALLKRNGISYNHWTAQNRLAKVDIDQSDPNKSTLLFTSTMDFNEPDSDAWFVAHDAICLVDKEIKACNSLLEKVIGKSFKVKQVRGVASPEDLSVYVKANGWEPRSAEVHVGNVERIIHNLGGEMLYGTHADNLEIVLREMIQNSRDSIKAREIFDDHFKGKIVVSLNSENASTWITIEDNGIGMSERILTGPLLDFGTSFWTSNLVQNEFPGLRSSKFRSIGKFGIGFYSIFMLAEQVFITSKNFKSGNSDVRQLKFHKGFSLRPVLSKEVPVNFNSSISTQLKFKLKPGIVSQNLLIKIKTNRMGSKDFEVPFENYIAAICGGLDVSVFYKGPNTNEILAHQDIDAPNFDKIKWLTDVTFLDFQPSPGKNKKYLHENFSRLKLIKEDDKIFGMAAISTKSSDKQQDFLSLATVGGLASSVHRRDGDMFLGFLDYQPKSARREIDRFAASDDVIKRWAQEQLDELLTMDLNEVEKYIASAALCKFKVDPSKLALILVMYEIKNEFLSFEQLAELSKKMKIVFMISSNGDFMETRFNFQGLKGNGYALIIPLVNSGPFLSVKIDKGVPENNFGIIDCLYRAILNKGYEPVLEQESNIGVSGLGHSVHAIKLYSK